MVLQLVLDGNVFLPQMKDLQEAFSAAVAVILRDAHLCFGDPYVACVPVHWEVIPQGLVSRSLSPTLISPRILKVSNKF